jgi:hypothetical protein
MLVLVAIAMAILVPTAAGAQTGEEWIRIQNGSQGYAFDCPKSAAVRRHDPEGILQIVLPIEHQVMMVRVHGELANLGVGDRQSVAGTGSEEMALAQTALEGFGTLAQIDGLGQVRVGGRQAIAVEWSGASQCYRMTILSDLNRAISINYPLGQPENEAIFERILETFRLTEFLQDEGLEIVSVSPETISSVPVPSYHQNDSRWNCDQLGNCVNSASCSLIKWECLSQPGLITIGDAGCAITSYAMIFEYYTSSHYKTPKELNQCYKTHGEYGIISGCGSCGRHWGNLNSSACKPGGVSYVGDLNNNASSRATVDADLQNGRPVMGEVPGHYVVIIGKSGSNYRVNNSAQGPSWPSQYPIGDFTKFIRFSGSVPDSVAPTTSPSLSGTAGENGWYHSDVQVTLTASDNDGGSGVDLVQYKINDGSWQDYSNPFTVSGEGDHSVYYKAQDKAGNWESQKRVAVPIDATAPTGSFTLDNGAATAPGVLVQVNPSAIDATSGVHQMRLRDAGGSWSDWQPYIDPALWQLPPVTGNSYTVEIHFKDWAGNESAVYQDAITLDVYPPHPSSAAYRLGRSTWGAAPWDKRSTNYRLLGTAGQSSIVGVLVSTNYRLRSGYWTEQSETYAVYLPLTLRQFP